MANKLTQAVNSCLQCKGAIPTRVVINGKERNLCNRKFCLECSPFGRHNTRNIAKPKPTHRRCYICKKRKKIEHYYERKGKDRRGDRHSYCIPCMNRRTIDKQKAIKIEAVAYKGGKCMDCGYCKYPGAMDFHHRNPKEKDFKISGRPNLTLGPELKKELDKCDLLCANCHRERHANLGEEHKRPSPKSTTS